VCFALFPAACPFSFYGFESILDHTRFLAHFGGVRAGLMTAVDPSNTEGLVSFPSFHTAGALMATWAVRRSRIWLTLLGVLNTGLIAATVLLGIHYVIDLLGAVALCGVSLALYRVLVPIAKPAAAGEILRPVAA
jgi:membrane-associated phospholipid phosphatase